jgi:hypothetical protein
VAPEVRNATDAVGAPVMVAMIVTGQLGSRAGKPRTGPHDGGTCSVRRNFELLLFEKEQHASRRKQDGNAATCGLADRMVVYF